MYSDLQYLSVPLPEDVSKLKYFGDFDRLNRVIDLKLQKDIPLALRKRLELEKEICALWPREYPHTPEAALAQLQACFTDFRRRSWSSCGIWIRWNGRISTARCATKTIFFPI